MPLFLSGPQPLPRPPSRALHQTVSLHTVHRTAKACKHQGDLITPQPPTRGLQHWLLGASITTFRACSPSLRSLSVFSFPSTAPRGLLRSPTVGALRSLRFRFSTFHCVLSATYGLLDRSFRPTPAVPFQTAGIRPHGALSPGVWNRKPRGEPQVTGRETTGKLWVTKKAVCRRRREPQVTGGMK